MGTLKITVLHEYGARNHYTALEYLCISRGYEIRFHEFSFVSQVKTIIKKRTVKSIKQLLGNIVYFINQLTLGNNSDEVVILGIAPLDVRLKWILRILKNEKIFIHNSWPEWKDGSFPKGCSSSAKLIWSNAIKIKILGLFAVSEKTREGFLNYFNVRGGFNTEVVYHSLNEQCYAGEEEIITKIKTSNLLFIGRLVEAKGLALVAQLATHFKDHNIHIIGDGPDKKLLFGHDNIIFHGYISDRQTISSIADKCSFLLQPSLRVQGWQEAFGLTVLESMARGIPVISTSQPGPKEIIDDGQGYILEEDQYVSESIKIIEHMDYNDWKEMSMSAFLRSQDFSKNKLSQKWSNLLDESLGR